MKRELLFIMAIMLILGACVSNKTFRSQQTRIVSLETKQNSQEALLEMANKDISDNREKIEAIILRLNMMDEELQLLNPLQTDLESLRSELGALTLSLRNLESELESAKDQNSDLDTRLNDFSEDTNETLDVFTEYLADFNDRSEGFASKDDLEMVIEESAALTETLNNITAELQTIHAELAEEDADDDAEELRYREMMNDFQAKIVNLTVQLNEARADIAKARDAQGAEVEELRMKVDNVKTELNGLTRDLEQIITKERAAAEKRRNEAMKKEYDAALKEYNARHHENSIIRFEEFLKAYPDSSLSPNAYYWIAENYYAAGVFAKALREFQNVVARYPEHPKAWDAQLKVGITYYRMDDIASAKAELLKIKTQNPAYPSMKTVDKYLKYTDK